MLTEMIAAIIILIASSVLASGILFSHQRMLTLLAAAGAFFEAQWLLLTLLDRTLLIATDTNTVFLAGSVLLAAIWVAQAKRWSWPYNSRSGSGKRDLFVLIPLGLVFASAWLIASYNGFIDHSWLVHGFYNGDTATFQALTQRSMLTDGLVDTNPFAGGGALEYPTLLHAGLATLLAVFTEGMNWFHFLPILTFVQILITVPLLFLVFDVVFAEPRTAHEKWFGVSKRWVVYAAQLGIVFYVLSLSWDNYIYPQGHFFLTAMFLLLGALAIRAYQARGKEQIIPVTASALLAAMLMLSNAVTGTAAVALFCSFALLRAGDTKRSPQERGVFLLVIAAFVAAFFSATPGNAAFGLPHFSYTAAIDMVRLVAPLLIIGFGIFWSVGERPVISTVVAVLSLLAVFTFFFSTRNIIIENASRFFYHAILVGFPLMLLPIIRAWFYIRRELFFTTHPLIIRAAGFGLAGVFIALLSFPSLASVASAHDNLMFKDEQRVPTEMRSALWWIQENISSDAVFVASTEPPFAVPAFTGRALLRTNYWLSPDDQLLLDAEEALVGDEAALESVSEHADYLLFTAADAEFFTKLPEENRVFTNGGVTIFEI